jgi:hypothetical protein
MSETNRCINFGCRLTLRPSASDKQSLSLARRRRCAGPDSPKALDHLAIASTSAISSLTIGLRPRNNDERQTQMTLE